MRRRALAGAAGLAVLALPALADPVIQTVNQPGFGRLVIDYGNPVALNVEQNGNLARFRFDAPGTPTLNKPPRNVQGALATNGALELRLAPGAMVRSQRVGTRIIIDVLDPPGVPRGMPQAKTPPAQAASEQASSVPGPHQNMQERPLASQVSGIVTGEAPLPQQVPSPVAAQNVELAAPLALAAKRVMLPGSSDPALLLPFAPDTGAALFHRGHQMLVVFDERRPLDLAAMRADADFASASVRLLPEATLLSLPERAAHLVSDPAGWILALGPEQSVRPVDLGTREHDVTLGLDRPGRSVVVPDPVGGGNLLVGTQLPPLAGRPAESQGVAIQHRAPAYTLLPTQKGVVIDPVSDQLTLRPQATGFVLDAGELDIAGPIAPAHIGALLRSATLTRAFALEDKPPEALLRLVAERVAGAAAAPPRGRRILRMQAAEAMIALGMGVEAQAALRVAAAEDAAHADDPDLVALAAVAAILADRLPEAARLADPRLDGNDEIALWRAVLQARLQENSASAASTFVTTLPLLTSYPADLRERLLPLAAETMAEGGQRAAAMDLVKRYPNDPTLAFARALLSEANDDADTALAAYDALAQGSDRKLRARAAWRAVELRFTTGRMNRIEAADALEQLLYAWRDEQYESALRARIAALRAATQPRAALALLRESESLFPSHATDFKKQRGSILTAMLKQPDSVPPLELVATVEDNPDLLPDVPNEGDLSAVLATRLMTLDLPQRAAPILERLMRRSDGVVRARFGLQLATVRQALQDQQGARDALADSETDGLPGELAESRAMVDAQALTSLGSPAKGAAALDGFTDEAAVRLRAKLLGDAGNWTGAAAELETLVARLPSDGALDDAQQVLLMDYAGATAQAADEGRMRSLAAYAPRLSAARQNLFRMLIAAPVRSVNDLERAGRELANSQKALALPIGGR